MTNRIYTGNSTKKSSTVSKNSKKYIVTKNTLLKVNVEYDIRYIRKLTEPFLSLIFKEIIK